ncbi:response regulator [Megalodesulfovibrio gigas]|nr:response regulator [Megalodesulfovibrio gigas]
MDATDPMHPFDLTPVPPRPLWPAGMRALVADSNRVSREHLCAQLSSLGIACVHVADGNEAAALLRGTLDFSVLFLDIQLPGQDGIDVFKSMRKGRAQPVPAVLTAACFNTRERRKAAQAGMHHLLEKPTSREQLAATLTALLGLDTPAPAAAPARTDPDLHALMRGASLLVVDDNPLNRVLAREMLEPFETVLGALDTANNGRDAVEAVRRRPYDIIFMDVQMPTLDGVAATRAIRSLPDRQDVAIVAITANASTEHVRACLDAGMDAYLGKPFHRQGLLDTIRTWLLRKQARPAAQSQEFQGPQAAAPRPAGLPEELPGLDLADGLIRFDGDAAMFRRFLLAFHEEFDDYDSEILLAAATRDFDRAAMLAHTLAGAAANVSACILHTKAKTLQEALQARTLRIKPQLDDVRQELGRVCEGILTVQDAPRA